MWIKTRRKKKDRLCAEEKSSVCFLCSPTWKVLSVGGKLINDYLQPWGYIFIHLLVVFLFVYTKNLLDFNETPWKDGQWAIEEPIKCWCRSRNFNLRRLLCLGRRLQFLSFWISFKICCMNGRMKRLSIKETVFLPFKHLTAGIIIISLVFVNLHTDFLQLFVCYSII